VVFKVRKNERSVQTGQHLLLTLPSNQTAVRVILKFIWWNCFDQSL
jgi:hypothetical protein